MATPFRMHTFVTGQSAEQMGCSETFCRLGSREPLLLIPQAEGWPLVATMTAQPVGRLWRVDEATVAARMREGRTLLCATRGPCQCVRRDVLIWEEGHGEEREVEREFPRVPIHEKLVS